MKLNQTIDSEAEVLAMLESFEIAAACPNCGKLSFQAMKSLVCPYCKNPAAKYAES